MHLCRPWIPANAGKPCNAIWPRRANASSSATGITQRRRHRRCAGDRSRIPRGAVAARAHPREQRVYRPPAANAAVAGVMSATRRAVPEQIVEARPPEISPPPRPDPVAVQPPSHAASNGDTPLVLRAEDQPAAEPARAVEAAQDLPVEGGGCPTVPGVPAAYAKFEQRAKRRRVDHRLDAARAAIEKGRLHDAAAALNEVLNLDPNAPELAALTASFNKLQRSERRPRRSRWLVAAVAFGATMLGASWLEQQQALRSRPMDVIAGLISSPQPVASSPQPVALPEGPPPAEAAPDAERHRHVGPEFRRGCRRRHRMRPHRRAQRSCRASLPLPETPIEPLLNSVGPVPVSRNTDPEVVSPPPPSHRRRRCPPRCQRSIARRRPRR